MRSDSPQDPHQDTQEGEECQRVERIRAGDEAAFERLFHTFYEDLCRFASQYVSASDVVKDLVQDVFFNVWERRRALDAQQSIQAYLYKAVRNEALKHLNRQRVRKQQGKPQQELRERSLQGSPEQALWNKELEAEAQKALDALPERRRRIFMLSREHDLTYAEIADLLDISIKTVETQMGRALGFLEKRLDEVLSVTV